MTSQLATIEAGTEAFVKAHSAKMADIDARIKKIQDEKAQAESNYAAEAKLWESAKEKVLQALKTLPEVDPVPPATCLGQPNPTPDLPTAFQAQMTAQWSNLMATPAIASIGNEALTAIMNAVASALASAPGSPPATSAAGTMLTQATQHQQAQLQQLMLQQQAADTQPAQHTSAELALQQQHQQASQVNATAAAAAAAQASAAAQAATAAFEAIQQQSSASTDATPGATSGVIRGVSSPTTPGSPAPPAKHPKTDPEI